MNQNDYAIANGTLAGGHPGLQSTLVRPPGTHWAPGATGTGACGVGMHGWPWGAGHDGQNWPDLQVGVAWVVATEE